MRGPPKRLGDWPSGEMHTSPHGSGPRSAVCRSGKEAIMNHQSGPAEPRPERRRPSGVYISAGAIVAIAIIVLLIILIF
jgi:hypothetical protein